MNNIVLQVQQFLREKGILICFSGKLSQELIEEYGEAVKKYMEAEDRPINEIYNIFSVFIEQTQNIKNYCSSKLENPHYDAINHSCIVTIGKTERSNYVSSGNLVLSDDIETLVKRVEELMTLDKAALKKQFKERMREDQPGAASAGLGLIDIARKSSKLEYSVTKMSESLSFFTLTAKI